jgi:hypothetical protein
MSSLHEEFQVLTSESHELEKKIVENMEEILSK